MNSKAILALAAGILLALETAAPAVQAEPRRDQQKVSAEGSRKSAASGNATTGSSTDKARQQAASSKRQHDEAKKIIDNLKD